MATVEEVITIQPGRRYRLFFGEGHRSNEIIHVVALLTIKNQGIYVVYLRYSQEKNKYRVHSDTLSLLEAYAEQGNLQDRGKSNVGFEVIAPKEAMGSNGHS